jgi:hypothetical protein
MPAGGEVILTAAQWIQLIVLGGIVGAAGQGTRVIVGLKKAGEEAAAAGKELHDEIVPSRLVVSLAIGFIAGALAAVLASIDLDHITLQQILALAAAGYAGADFIEGAMSKFVPKKDEGSPSSPSSQQSPPLDSHLG